MNPEQRPKCALCNKTVHGGGLCRSHYDKKRYEEGVKKTSGGIRKKHRKALDQMNDEG